MGIELRVNVSWADKADRSNADVLSARDSGVMGVQLFPPLASAQLQSSLVFPVAADADLRDLWGAKMA